MDKVVEEVETAAGVGWVAGGDSLHDADLVLRGVGVLGRALDDLQSDVLAQLRVVRAPHGREVAPADLAHHDVASVVECVADVHRVVSAAAVALHALVLAHSPRKRHLCVRQCRLETQKQRKKGRKRKKQKGSCWNMKMNGVCVCMGNKRGAEGPRRCLQELPSWVCGGGCAVGQGSRERTMGWGAAPTECRNADRHDEKKGRERKKKGEESKRRGKRQHNLAKRRMTTDTQEDSCGQSSHKCKRVLVAVVLCEWSQTLTIAQTQTQVLKPSG